MTNEGLLLHTYRNLKPGEQAMFFIRPIIVMFMRWWIEDRAKRRKEADEKIVSSFFASLRDSAFSGCKMWKKISQRLQGRLKRALPEWLNAKAENADSDMPTLIKNARSCGVDIPIEEEQRLYSVAMMKAYGPHKLAFAKLIYGNDLSLTIVLDILETICESYHPLMGSNNEHIEPFLKEIDCDDTEAVHAFAMTLAQQGRYHHLHKMYGCLKQEVPHGILRICLESSLQQETIYFHPVTDMCIRLKDWETGKQLIERWRSHKKGRDHAAWIALAMYEAQQQELVQT